MKKALEVITQNYESYSTKALENYKSFYSKDVFIKRLEEIIIGFLTESVGHKNFKSSDEKIFSVTSHRGPDNTSKVEVGSFTLGHNRLSIMICQISL